MKLKQEGLNMGDLTTPEERRKHQRYPIDLPLNFRMTENSHIYSGLSVNASEAGLLIQTFQDMPIGSRLNIELLFVKEYELSNFQGMAQVVWKDHYVWSECEGFKYGLQFVRISNEDHKKLKFLLENPFNPEEASQYQAA
ncbi:MAG: PilZ domain-containing protein [Thermodesulfobacteriota bacterium]